MELDEWKRKLASDGALRAAAGSPEAKALSGRLDAAAAEEALRRGDTATLKRLLGELLSTPEGQRLAQTVKTAVRRDG